MTTAADLEARLRNRQRELDRRTGEALELARRGKEAEAAAARYRAEASVNEQLCAVFTRLGEQHQAAVQRQVEEFVTRGLQVIFGEELSFRLVPRVVRDQASLEFVLVTTRDGQAVETGVYDGGGGRAALVGFILRFVMLLLTPGATRFLALDESFANVSESFVPRLAEFLREVAYKAGVQVFLVTHSTGYGDVADVRYRLVLGPDGATQAHEGESE